MKYRNIIISGDVGTGTSTLAKGLATELRWKLVSVGDFFRKWHKKNNIPLWNKLSIPVKIELEADKKYRGIIEREKNVVLDGHYLGWFAKDLDDIFRILLTADKKVTTKRVLDREHTHKEKPEEITERRRQLREKFKKLYTNDDYEDPKIYDLVIDTTETGEKETLQRALNGLKEN